MSKVLQLSKAVGFQLITRRANGRAEPMVEICTRTHGGGWLINKVPENLLAETRKTERELALRLRDQARNCSTRGTRSAL